MAQFFINRPIVAIVIALLFVIGGTVGLVVALTDIRGRNAFVFCFVMPLLLAAQVVALAWLQLFGPSSPLLAMLGIAPPLGSRNPLYSAEGIILVLGVQYAPLVFLTLRAGLLAGMGMTEKQGGSDVRANTTIARPASDGAFELTGHKWFCSAPMSDAFFTLARLPEGVTCFFVP